MEVNGGCYCGNILVEVNLPAAPESYQPRACDCEFCRKHGAAYVSDAQGSLVVDIRNPVDSGGYRQGSGQAEFFLCRTCGVLVGVLFRSEGRLYGAVNIRALQGSARFAEVKPTSPQKLSAEAKAQRWQDVWFANVELRGIESRGDDAHP